MHFEVCDAPERTSRAITTITTETSSVPGKDHYAEVTANRDAYDAG